MTLINKIKSKLQLSYRKKRWPGLIEAYKQYLPVTKKTPIISLNEGNTPLIFSDSISKLIGNGKINLIKFFESYQTKTVILDVNSFSKVMNKVESISELLEFFTNSPLEKIKTN